ncbi:uncharacterized protein RHO25_003965 [Cercospora beticola]|uniref:Heterokaryon incompatibility domain-containing protein n=1 Tax=Cercospora beticola TaxID=122368 RepID=A0ABZ0NIH7_CERBT|nr:hypothetical protein RHO25_003965 [Cercospora beticola]CAK1360676.1 unnamed protein product [Cercospora beticola]
MARIHRRPRWRQLKNSLPKHIPTHRKPASTSSLEPQKNSSEANSGDPKPVDPEPVRVYSLVPLVEDPRNEIRLLRFVSDVGHSPLALRTSVCSLHDAPPYVAISYTWGNHNTRTAVIDGEPVQIRYNAYYALRQVQLHHRQIHIWIDSICINQNNDAEKSAQVAIMFQIYEQAAHVAACLGVQFKDAEWLFTVVRCLEPLLGRARWAPNLQAALTEAFFPEHEEPLGLRLLAAILALDKHPYWKRIWVVQEVAAARSNVELLSGPHRVSAIAMGSLNDRARWYRYWEVFDTERYQGDANRILAIVGYPFVARRPLYMNLDKFGEFHCSDPRDRLFALIGITDWEESGCPRIIPDYTKSAWDLALEVGPTLDPVYLRFLIRALEIAPENEEVAGLQREQRFCARLHAMRLRPELRNELDADWSSPTFAGRKFRRSNCFRLRATASVSLYADIGHGSPALSLTFHIPALRAKGDSSYQMAKPIINEDGRMVALVCPDARPDDILIAVRGLEGVLLIVRESETKDAHYSIIGQGVLTEEYGDITGSRRGCSRGGPCSCSPEFFARRSTFTADVHVALTIEELIAPGAQQQGTSYTDKSSRVSAGFERIATRPTTRPRNAVFFTNFSCIPFFAWNEAL